MVERKVYKTRLCVLYKKGHCHRQTCSFAHGDAELRRYNNSSSFNGRRDYRGGDLRDKLGRRRSPPRRNSPDRDARDRHPSRGDSSPRSAKRSNWNNRRRQRIDGGSDYSGSLRTSDGTEDQGKENKPASSEFKHVHDEQLKQVQSEIDMLEDHKQQLEVYLEERIQEADSLNSKIQELEMQLSMEREECRRISSKIKKFLKAQNRHSRIQDELKRSQARLQKLGDQLGSDARASVNEEDISIDILSDEENNHQMNQPNERRKNDSPIKKRLRLHLVETDEEMKQGNSRKGERLNMGKMRSAKHSRWDTHLAQFNDGKEMAAEANGISSSRALVNEGKPRQGKIISASTPLDKSKDSESGLVLPTTGMAAHADEVVEVVELDEKFEAEARTSTRDGKGAAHDITGKPFPLPPPPPPPILQSAYSQYKGKDENVDVDGLDDEMLDVDIV